jgi:coenzyme PQQ precursor peptide PqqA
LAAPQGFDPPQKRAASPECRLLKPAEMANMFAAGSQPELQPEDKTMAWKTPKIVEVSLASEINCYACAEIG